MAESFFEKESYCILRKWTHLLDVQRVKNCQYSPELRSIFSQIYSSPYRRKLGLDRSKKAKQEYGASFLKISGILSVYQLNTKEKISWVFKNLGKSNLTRERIWIRYAYSLAAIPSQKEQNKQKNKFYKNSKIIGISF